MNKTTPAILEAIGGERVLATAVEQFYERVIADPLLKLYFKNTDMTSLKRRFQKYLTYILADNEAGYDGRTMYEAHSGRGITDEAVDIFLEKFRETLIELKVPTSEVEKIGRKLALIKDVVVDKFVFPGTYVYKPDSEKGKTK